MKTETFTESEIKHVQTVKQTLIDTLYDDYLNLKIAPFSTSHNNFFAGIQKTDLFLSGGAIASLLQGEDPKDYDIYSRISLTGEFREKLLSAHNDDIADVDEKYASLEMNGKVVTSRAISMKSRVQYILMHSGTPAQVKATFDFVHCTPHFSFIDNKLYISKKQYDACVNKKLIVNNPDAVTDKRIQKFKDRGYVQ